MKAVTPFNREIGDGATEQENDLEKRRMLRRYITTKKKKNMSKKLAHSTKVSE